MSNKIIKCITDLYILDMLNPIWVQVSNFLSLVIQRNEGFYVWII